MANDDAPPAELPLFPIRGCTLLPGEALPLNVFEPRYLNMVDDALAADHWLGIIQPKPEGPKDKPHLERIGGAGRIAHCAETEDGRYLIVLQGALRFRLTGEAQSATPYRVGLADYGPFSDDLAEKTDAAPSGLDRAAFLDLLKWFFKQAGMDADWDSVERAPVASIADKVAMAAPFDAAAKQALLEAADPIARARTLATMMHEALDQAGPAGLA